MSKLHETQMKIIEESLQERMKSGEIKSKAELSRERKKYKDRLNVQNYMGSAQGQSGLSDSTQHNDSFSGIELDLKAAFAQLLSNEEDLTKHGVLNRSIISQLNGQIDKIEDEVARQRELLRVNYSEDIRTESFLNGRDNEVVQYEVGKGVRAEWNKNSQSLELPLIGSKNVFIADNGMKLGKVKVRKKLGRSISESSESTIDNIFNTDEGSFWSEHIYSDSPLEVDMGEEYYNIDRGAICELEVSFDYLTSINQIGMEGIGGYPFEVVSITYFSTDEEEVGTELVSSTAEDPSMKSTLLKDRISFTFPLIEAKRLRILLNQKHGVRQDILISSKKEKHERLLGNGAGNYPSNGDAEYILKDLTTDRKEYITRYEYKYGMYNVELAHKEYGDVGVYVSKEFDMESAIRSVRIESDEIHPLNESTSIEYELGLGNEWIPILPTDRKTVESEHLSFTYTDGGYRAKLRFKAVPTEVQFYRNGENVDESIAIILEDGQSVVVREYDPSSYYTVSYRPGGNPWNIDLTERVKDEEGYLVLNRKTEEFNGTDKEGRILLSECHVVDRKRINEQIDGYDPSILSNEYVPSQVRIVTKEGFRIGQPTSKEDKHIRILNKTDYFSEEDVYLEPYDDSITFYQYEIRGKEILFNTPIDKDAKVIVEYDYMVSRVKMRCTLKKSTVGDNGRTPLLRKYSIRTKKIR